MPKNAYALDFYKVVVSVAISNILKHGSARMLERDNYISNTWSMINEWKLLLKAIATALLKYRGDMADSDLVYKTFAFMATKYEYLFIKMNNK